MTPAELRARVLYQDPLMLVIDKPAGLAVHAGPGGGDNLERHFDALRFGQARPPALAHRLDRDTSGCLILGRHQKGLRKLGKLFQQGRIEKTYWAVVEGAPPEPAGTVALPLRKLTPKGGWKMVVDHAAGQDAITDYRVLGQAGGRSWLELRPRTGRTHQIRVHCAELGCPIVGEPLYGRVPGAPPPREPLHLHARRLVIPLYAATRPPVTVEAPPPAHMRKALLLCGYRDDPPAGAMASGVTTSTPMPAG